MNLTLDKVGADVEFFLVDTLGNPVPCIGIVGGTKKRPLPLIPHLPGYMIQEDNVALEWGIPPASNKWDFVYSVQRVKEEIEMKLAPKGLKSVILPSVRFSLEQLNHPQARLLGCEDDYNAWLREVNEKPDISGENETLRTSGGHVHVSFKIDGHVPSYPQNLTEAECLVMAFDIYIACASVLLDSDNERRKLYGKAGAFRPKPYGLEYRVLSSFWTKFPNFTAWIYDQVETVFSVVRTLPDAHEFFLNHKDAVNKAVNFGDRKLAQALIQQFCVQMPK